MARAVIFLVRHGETEWNRVHRYQGWGDSPGVAGHQPDFRNHVGKADTRTSTFAAAKLRLSKERHQADAEPSRIACHLPPYQPLILASSSGSARLQFICGRNFSSVK